MQDSVVSVTAPQAQQQQQPPPQQGPPQPSAGKAPGQRGGQVEKGKLFVGGLRYEEKCSILVGVIILEMVG